MPLNPADTKDLMVAAIEAAVEAGKDILSVYKSDFSVQEKADRSPLTLADMHAHRTILKRLNATELPVLSEEGRDIPYDERKQWKRFWMVDPLDGTKEFVKRNGEFTVNIALIQSGEPVAGVIYVPVRGMLYFSTPETGSYRCDSATEGMRSLEDGIACSEKLPLCRKEDVFTVVASRSHLSEETERYISELRKSHGALQMVSMGSSLKICLVAEGKADIYPRFAPTMEWDTAAGHAIVKGAGREIYDYNTGKPMLYNKANLLNNWFVVR